MEALEGSAKFTEALRERTQLIIHSDTYEEFAKPLMKKLGWPTLFCNSLVTLADGTITGYTLRQKNGKREAVKALASLNMDIFAAGDSFNDLQMIREAKAGCLFRAPEAIRKEYADIPCVDSYGELLEKIDRFLAE
jgi:phosphoserine/homoserine phosphotransferase